MQTVIEQHLQAPVGLFLVFLHTLKASIGLANFQVSMFCEFRLDLYKKIKLFFVLCKFLQHCVLTAELLPPHPTPKTVPVKNRDYENNFIYISAARVSEDRHFLILLYL